MGVIFIKFDLACEVTANGEKLGYIEDKKRFEQFANDIIDENNEPEYHLTFVAKTEELNDEKVLAKLKESIELKNGDKSIELAKVPEKSSKKITKSTNKKVTSRGSSPKILNKSTLDKNNTTKDGSQEITKSTTNDTKETEAKSSKKTTKKVTSLNGVKLTVKPISGIITSRFGGRESIRSSGHSGLDIAAPKGTKIKVAASGTITFSGYSGAYGNVVKVSHGSGVKTYYAHCSKLYVKKGQKVSAGDVIATVGSTGRSTGNHLHFEVVKNGISLNPQNYLY